MLTINVKKQTFAGISTTNTQKWLYQKLYNVTLKIGAAELTECLRNY